VLAESPEPTGLIPLNTLLDIDALKPGRQTTLTQATDGPRSPVAARGTDATVVAATQSLVFGQVTEEGTAQQIKGPMVPEEDTASSFWAEGLAQWGLGLTTAQQQVELSASDFHKVLLGKLFLVSIAALALYYLPGGRAGHKESTELPDPRANNRLP
jgi:hypothetical protein